MRVSLLHLRVLCGSECLTVIGCSSCLTRDRGSILGPSTGPKLWHIFTRQEYSWRRFSRGCPCLLIDLINLFAHPAHARNLNLSVRRDPEQRRHIGQAVSIRRRIRVGVIQQNWERYTVFLDERRRVLFLVLRDANQGHVPVAVGLENPLKIRKRKLTNRAGDLEERRQYRSANQRVFQRELFPIHGWQREIRCCSPHR